MKHSLQVLEAQQPLATAYFKHALESATLAHGYVFKGRGLAEMYTLALTLAQILNCENRLSSTQGCDHCANCQWIEQNAHPAVMTISRLTSLVSDRGQDLSEADLQKLAKRQTQQTQIKAEQIDRLLHHLGLSSQYYRIIIFTDAEELPGSTPSLIPPPAEWKAIPGNEEKSFHLRPLERHLFNAASANRFLKTLEEPPPKTLFFFLTDTEENLLETIVSRCQVIPFVQSSSGEKTHGLSPEADAFYQTLLSQLAHTTDFYTEVSRFQEHLETTGLNLSQGLEQLQVYLWSRFRQQTLERQPFKGYAQQQQQLEESLKMLHAKTNPEQVLNHLFLSWSRA